ncbi:hypothetical protein [Peribacillus frigoritolerans]|uniref:hypothetical protein n=1 Tax=Peribacillus frigoritolerans TaxID=450367 RepID=UPI0020411480|nr:hypothetical protein [Peribacillus frigoritolerans]MCM3166101.1 hypothetical protein [Peribacillus frigoritolerans]
MRTIQVSEMINEQKFNRFYLQILLCCIFIIICDGYDMFMLGTILPSLMAEWRITAVEVVQRTRTRGSCRFIGGDVPDSELWLAGSGLAWCTPINFHAHTI